MRAGARSAGLGRQLGAGQPRAGLAGREPAVGAWPGVRGAARPAARPAASARCAAPTWGSWRTPPAGGAGRGGERGSGAEGVRAERCGAGAGGCGAGGSDRERGRRWLRF